MGLQRLQQRAERGEGRAGCVLWSLILGIVVMVSVKVIPVQMSVMKLRDQMEEAAQLRWRDTSRKLERFILDRAAELDLPVGPKDVVVKKGGGRVKMDVNFTVPLDFYIFQKDWEIEIEMTREIYQF
jgi:hypothetical protein